MASLTDVRCEGSMIALFPRSSQLLQRLTPLEVANDYDFNSKTQSDQP